MTTFEWTSLFTNNTLTRSNFITNVRSRFDEDISDYISDNQIIEFIREGLNDISFRTNLLPEYATVTLDGSTTYTLPDDLVEMWELVHLNTDNSVNSNLPYQLLTSINYQELEDQGIFVNGFLRYYIRNGQTIDIIGADNVQGQLRTYGVRVPTFPNTDNDYIDLPKPYIELLYLWCEWKFFSRRRVPDEAASMRDMYLSRCEQVRRQVESQYSRGLSLYG